MACLNPLRMTSTAPDVPQQSGVPSAPSVLAPRVPAEVLLKAQVVGSTPDQASQPGGEADTAFASAGALEPPYDPEALCQLFEHSNSLRQNVDAYATNIDGNGYRFDAVIDFDAEDARSKVADAITLERMTFGDGILAAEPFEACCFPFAQHYLTTSFPTSSPITDRDGLTQAVATLNASSV